MRVKRIIAAALLVFVTAAAATAAPLETPPTHNSFAAVVENRIWTENPAEAQQFASLIADAGYNAVRIFVPYSPGQAEIENDKRRLCNAAVAARDHGLALIVSLLGINGYVPQGWSRVDRLIKTINDHMYYLFQVEKDQNGQTTPMGCTTDVKQFDVEIFNEINGKTWHIEPDQYARILARVYPAVKAKAAELGVSATVFAGALTSKDNPLDYIRQWGAASTTRSFDVFTFHPYPLSSGEPPVTRHPDGTFVGLGDYSQLTSTLKQAFGYIPPIFYSELGYESEIPKSQQYRYQGNSPATVRPVPEPTQGQFYAKVRELVSQQPGTIGFADFHLIDDPEMVRWQSGTYYADGGNPANPLIAKTSLSAVRQANQWFLSEP